MVRCRRTKSEARRDPARMFERLDTNDDGMVSAEEFAEARMGDRGGKGHWRQAPRSSLIAYLVRAVQVHRSHDLIECRSTTSRAVE